MTISELIFKENTTTVEELKEKYPPRSLPTGAMVTRFAPSPTGFLHLGSLYPALISERFAKQSQGIFFIRLEDTDQVRKVDNSDIELVKKLAEFNVVADEGFMINGERGEYGPYVQSARCHIYDAFLKHLMDNDLIYPCFATKEELEEAREEQTKQGLRPGYYGKWAKWRTASRTNVEAKLEEKTPFVLRFKSSGDHLKKFKFTDLIKGELELSENDIDFVVRKADGLPTYHFAHVVDDFLMGTTHVLRGDEWLASVPLHVELTRAFGFPGFEYAHIAPIRKLDENGNKRKLSKRYDKEANVEYFQELGYPTLAISEYLMNLASSDFEEWRNDNPYLKYSKFILTFEKLAQSTGPVFDEIKLQAISKQIITSMPQEERIDDILAWSKEYNKEFYLKISSNLDYWKQVFSLDSDSRKDYSNWSEAIANYEYFDTSNEKAFDWKGFSTPLTPDEIKFILDAVLKNLNILSSSEEFMEFLRGLATQLNLAQNIKELKANPEKYRGHVGLVAQVVRFAVTGRTNTPDLFSILNILGKDEVTKRLQVAKL